MIKIAEILYTCHEFDPEDLIKILSSDPESKIMVRILMLLGTINNEPET